MSCSEVMKEVLHQTGSERYTWIIDWNMCAVQERRCSVCAYSRDKRWRNRYTFYHSLSCKLFWTLCLTFPSKQVCFFFREINHIDSSNIPFTSGDKNQCLHNWIENFSIRIGLTQNLLLHCKQHGFDIFSHYIEVQKVTRCALKLRRTCYLQVPGQKNIMWRKKFWLLHHPIFLLKKSAQFQL